MRLQLPSSAFGMGFLHAARIDVSSFYESFEFEKLSPILPLSLEVVEHVVFGRYMKAKGANVKGLYASHSSWDDPSSPVPPGASPRLGLFTYHRRVLLSPI